MHQSLSIWKRIFAILSTVCPWRAVLDTWHNVRTNALSFQLITFIQIQQECSFKLGVAMFVITCSQTLESGQYSQTLESGQYSQNVVDKSVRGKAKWKTGNTLVLTDGSRVKRDRYVCSFLLPKTCHTGGTTYKNDKDTYWLSNHIYACVHYIFQCL